MRLFCNSIAVIVSVTCKIIKIQALKQLNNKNAFAIWASRGIGLTIAKVLMDEEAQVAGWSPNKAGYNHVSLRQTEVVVSDMNSADNAFRETLPAFENRVDILANNAGISDQGDFEKIPVDNRQPCSRRMHVGAYFQ